MYRGWLLFGAGVVLAVAGTVLTLFAAFVTPGGRSLLLFAGAGLTFAGGYRCLTRSRETITATAYQRVGVERNPDGTVGEAGAETERSRSADIDYEPPTGTTPRGSRSRSGASRPTTTRRVPTRGRATGGTSASTANRASPRRSRPASARRVRCSASTSTPTRRR
ncbi:hypothetical protein [Halosegnis longus]|uniref:hypothetical protein n=1 Tax=Halosegnis longus TaxID=2216012 RepID=UPI0026BA2EA5